MEYLSGINLKKGDLIVDFQYASQWEEMTLVNFYRVKLPKLRVQSVHFLNLCFQKFHGENTYHNMVKTVDILDHVKKDPNFPIKEIIFDDVDPSLIGHGSLSLENLGLSNAQIKFLIHFPNAKNPEVYGKFDQKRFKQLDSWFKGCGIEFNFTISNLGVVSGLNKFKFNQNSSFQIYLK